MSFDANLCTLRLIAAPIRDLVPHQETFALLRGDHEPAIRGRLSQWLAERHGTLDALGMGRYRAAV